MKIKKREISGLLIDLEGVVGEGGEVIPGVAQARAG
jgi:ribonucleotide monophosphatase NagD (HAD superfamily)